MRARTRGSCGSARLIASGDKACEFPLHQVLATREAWVFAHVQVRVLTSDHAQLVLVHSAEVAARASESPEAYQLIAAFIGCNRPHARACRMRVGASDVDVAANASRPPPSR